MYLPALFRKINPKKRSHEFCAAAVTCSPLLNVDFDRWADVFQRVENGAHRHGEVWREGGGCGVAAAENTMLGVLIANPLPNDH